MIKGYNVLALGLLFLFLNFTSSLYASPPKLRVVTLAPSLGEVISQLDLNQLDWVGASEWTPALSSSKNIQSIGPLYRVNIEKILSLKPDIIFATTEGNDQSQVLRLKQLSQKVMIIDTPTISSLAQSFVTIADQLEQHAQGVEIKDRFLKKWDALKTPKPTGTLIAQIGDHPLVVVGTSNFLTQIINHIGFNNPFAQGTTKYPRPSIEKIVSLKPKIYLILSSKDQSSTKTSAIEWSTRFKQTPTKVVLFESDALFKPSPALVDEIARLKEVLLK